MNKKQISASILSADFARLGEDCHKVLEAGADMVHFDVMDNHYVPNLTIGSMVCQSLRDFGIEVPIDVHLMVNPVDDLIKAFAKAGASLITFHPEATEHVDRSLELIRDLGCKAGLAYNPATPLNTLKHVMDKVDLILIMSVNPGFGGQKFIEHSIDKVREAHMLASITEHDIHIAVDGGVTLDNIGAISDAGADIFVAGSSIFKSKSYKATIDQMRSAIENN